MSSTSTYCLNPACCCPVQAGDAFCPHCGQALAEAPAAQTSGLPPDRLALERNMAGERPFLNTAISETPNALDFARSPELAQLADFENALPSTQAAAAAQDQSDCADLEVRYNNSCVFVLNMQSTFDFEILPLAEGIRDLFVDVRQSGQAIAREKPMVVPKHGVPIHFGLNYMPRHTRPGKVSFVILVGYRKGSQRRLYAAYRTHTIYSGKEDPRRVCDNLVVEVKNNIQQGHAGDMRVDQSFDGLRDALRGQNTIALDKEFLDLINGRPFWAPLVLAECPPDALPALPPGPAPVAARHSLILRQDGGTSIHLLTQDCVRIGRSRDCEILARLHDAAGHELREPTLRISRYHARIEWKNDGWRLADRGSSSGEGRGQPSGTGVWVNGKRIAVGGDFMLSPGREYTISLGASAPGQPAGFELRARIWVARDIPPLRPGCPDINDSPDAPAGLVLWHDPGNAAYLLLRGCASLGWVDPRWSGACVCRRDSALHFSDGCECDWLAPGRRVRTGAIAFEVLEKKDDR